MPRRAAAVATCLLIAGSLVASVEVPVSKAAYAGAPYLQQQPQAASDGTDFLIAWRDYREQLTEPPIYAARVAWNGGLLDSPSAIRIPDPHDKPVTASTNAPPAVAWTGSLYIVAWDDWQTRSIRYVRIDRDGNLLDSTPRGLPDAAMLHAGAAASSSHGAMLVYSDPTLAQPSIHGILFATNGEVAVPDIPFPHANVDDSPVIAASDASFLVAWRRWDGFRNWVVIARAAFDGTLSPERVVDISLSGPALASNGHEFALVYVDINKDTAFTEIDAGGATLSHTTLGFTAPWPFYDNIITGRRGGYILALHGPSNSVVGFALAANGTRMAQIQLTTNSVADGAIAFASNPTSTIVAWPETRIMGTISTDIFARVFDSPAETLVSTAAVRQSDSRIASSPAAALAVWLEHRGLGDAEVRASRIAADGRPLDSDGIKIGQNALQPAAVVFDGHNYVVAWIDRSSSSLKTSRVSPAGALLDGPDGRVAVAPVYDFGLGSNGRDALLTWTGFSDSVGYWRAGRLSADGMLEPPFIDLPSNKHGVGDIAISGNADTWLVTASDVVTPANWPFGAPPPISYNIIALRISSSLNLLDGAPIALASDTGYSRHPAVATNDRDFLVVWDEFRSGTSGVAGRTVAHDAAIGNTIFVGAGSLLGVIWQDDAYTVGWQNDGDLFTARFGDHPIATPVAASADPESDLTLALLPGRTLLALYERMASERIYGHVTRVFLRTVTPSRVRSVHR